MPQSTLHTSKMGDSSRSAQIQSVARIAIERINELVGLIGNNNLEQEVSSLQATADRVCGPSNNPASCGPSTFTSSRHNATSNSGAATATSSTRQLSALSELQRRFPTTANRNIHGRFQRIGNNNSRPRNAPYIRGSNQRGRPSVSDIVTRDVIILEQAAERVPTKTEKLELERKGHVISGFDFNRQWSDTQLYDEVKALLPLAINFVDFEFVKNSGGAIIKPTIPRNKKIDGKLLLKSISPTGSIYIRLLEDLAFCQIDDSILEVPALGHIKTEEAPTEMARNIQDVGNVEAINISDDEIESKKPSDPKCSFEINEILEKGKNMQLSDPVEVLQFLQNEIVKGRPLELSSADEESPAGAVNYITVDRDNILVSTFSELEYIADHRLTYQVDFMNEESVDLGGPRKEWLMLMNKAIKEKYFDHGLREFLSKDYVKVGVMIGTAMLQNGQLPAFLEESQLQQIISLHPMDKCIYGIQKGLEQTGMLSALRGFPMLLHLLRKDAQRKLSVQSLLFLLKPAFAEVGSNALTKEKEVYQLFIKYVREIAAGRRSSGGTVLDLANVLQFVTGATEEPILGFHIKPSIEFVLPSESKVISSSSPDDSESNGTIHEKIVPGFTPTAHTCVNVLKLPRGTLQHPLPTEERLFSIYDLAFGQAYFGLQ